jgi:FlaG/FlaF family flagellin (archaellin)
MNIADKIRNQFPEFIESEYPTFIKFVEHYYEFLESAELILENTNGIYTTGEKIVGQTSGLEATIRAVDHPNSRIFISTQNKFIISEEIRQIPSINSQGDGRVDLEAVAVRILEITTNTAPNDALTTLLKSLQSGVYDFILEDGVSELLLENNDNISFEEYTSIAIYPDNILEFGSITVSNTSIIDQGTFIETNEIEDNGDIQTESIILTRKIIDDIDNSSINEWLQIESDKIIDFTDSNPFGEI